MRATGIFGRKIQEPLLDGGVIDLAREFLAALGLFAEIGGLVRQLYDFPYAGPWPPSDT